jgi:hypothetical protein
MVHAAVVLVPLLALGGVAYAVAPFLRRHLWLPVAFLALAAPAAIVAAKLSGDEFRKNPNMSVEMQPRIDAHSGLGERAMWFSIGLAVLVLVLIALVRAGGPARPKRGPDDTLASPPRGGAPLILQVLLGALTIGVAGATLYYVFRTGDSGAKMVWDRF